MHRKNFTLWVCSTFPGIRGSESFYPIFRHNNQMKAAYQNYEQKGLTSPELRKNVPNCT